MVKINRLQAFTAMICIGVMIMLGSVLATTLEVTSPSGNYVYIKATDTLNITFNATSLNNMDSLWYQYNGINTTIISAGSGSPIVAENYQTSNVYSGFDNAYWKAQSFTAGLNGNNGGLNFNITKLSLRLLRESGTPTCNVIAGIRASSGGAPTGSDLSNGTILASSIVTTTDYTQALWYNFTMTPYTLVSGTVYDIVLRMPGCGSSGNEVGVNLETTDGSYSGGNYYDSSNSGAGWGSTATSDMNFQIFGLSLHSSTLNFTGKTTFIPVSSNKSMIVYSNDSVGDIATQTANWDYNIFENFQTYSATTYETANETFSSNVTLSSGYTFGNIFLVYNNTVHMASESGGIYSTSLTIPIPPASGTVNNFFWNYTIINSTGIFYIQSSSNVQTVNLGTALSAGSSCIAGTSPALNFTVLYEQNNSIANASTVNYIIKYGLSGNSTAKTISGTLNNVVNFAICINNSQLYYSVGEGEIDYSVPGTVDRKYYVFQNTRITNVTANIPIYSLETASATSFLFTAETTALSPYVGYFVGLMRWYPALNAYKIVDMGKTDGLGQTILRVKVEDVDYRLALYSPSGSLVTLLAPVRMICQTNPCTYSIFVDSTPLDLTTYTAIQQSLTYDKIQKKYTFVWNDPSQVSQTMNLSVWKITGTGNVLVCSQSASSYTGVLICDVSAQNGQLKAEVWRTASPPVKMVELWSELKQTFIDVGGGIIGLLFGAILFIFFVLIGIYNPYISVILGILALIPLFFMGVIPAEVLMAVGVIGGVILHFIGRTR